MANRWTSRHLLLIVAFILLSVSAGVGIVYRTFSNPIPHAGPSFTWSNKDRLTIDLVEAKRAFDLEAAVFIDTRPHRSYVGSHISGAISLPLNEFENRVHELLSGLPTDMPIITYCSGGACQSSVKLAKLLIERLGYTNTRVFYDGWDMWVSAGYPTTHGDVP